MNGTIQVAETGGPSALTWVETEIPRPGPQEILVRNKAIGLNFLDVYFRSGRYPWPLPFVPGHEGAGIVEAVGEEVTDFAPGDRVGYIDPIGAYAQWVVRPSGRTVKLPENISFEQAAATLLKGVTAEYLVRRTHAVTSGETILVHAAAGGVGQILCQWASAIGATVIGTVGTEAKRELARQAGCHHVIVTAHENFVDRVVEITQGKLVPVVYDGVGGDYFMPSLDCIAPRGLMVSFGASGGPPPPLEVQLLAAKGSLFLTRPGILAYTSTPEMLRESAVAVFEMISNGRIKVDLRQTYALKDAALAHRDLEARKLTGSTVLLP